LEQNLLTLYLWYHL